MTARHPKGKLNEKLKFPVDQFCMSAKSLVVCQETMAPDSQLDGSGRL